MFGAIGFALHCSFKCKVGAVCMYEYVKFNLNLRHQAMRAILRSLQLRKKKKKKKG